MATHPDGDSGAAVSATQSPNWWRSARSVNLMTVDVQVKERLKNIALHGKRCLVTCETSPPSAIHTCNLIPKATSSGEIRDLQYAWGRKLSPDNEWNLLYLRSDIHNGFNNGAWALVPERAVVTRIHGKITAEMDRRAAGNIKGPWPDFMSPEWFPTNPNPPYKYHFVALENYDFPPVITRRKLPGEDAPSATVHSTPYSEFPILESHMHPYMAIMNAYPKLLESRRRIPGEVGAMMSDLIFIYNCWTKAHLDADPVPSTSSKPSTHTGGSGSGRPGLRSGASTRSGTNKAGATTHSAGSSGQHRERGGSFDAQDADMHSILSNSTPDDSPSCQDPLLLPPISTSCAPDQGGDLGASQVAPIQVMGRVAKWVQGVEAARTHSGLEDIADDTELDTVEETCRTPVEDWHAWRSEFAPWYVLMPKNRGLLSSNDWVEVENYPPLTRALEDEAS